MVYPRPREREPKRIVVSHISTPEDKMRRHRNKERIWKRATARLQFKSLAHLENTKAPA